MQVSLMFNIVGISIVACAVGWCRGGKGNQYKYFMVIPLPIHILGSIPAVPATFGSHIMLSAHNNALLTFIYASVNP